MMHERYHAKHGDTYECDACASRCWCAPTGPVYPCVRCTLDNLANAPIVAWKAQGHVEQIPSPMPPLTLGREILVGVARTDGRSLDNEVLVEPTTWRAVIMYRRIGIVWGRVINSEPATPLDIERAVVLDVIRECALGVRNGESLRTEIKDFLDREIDRLGKFIEGEPDG